MKRTSFRSARSRVPAPFRKLAASVIVLMSGLVLTASAKDGSFSDSLVAAATADAKNAARAGAGPKGGAGANKAGARAGAKAGAKAGARSRRWFQVGTASWYGMKFQGRKTAGGESFDMNGMTCAHPTLPMGTWVRVTNLKNRRTAFVRVNDRGPVIEGRIVDLSAAAARRLGLAGLGKVKLEAVREGDADLAKALVAQVQMPDSSFPWSARNVGTAWTAPPASLLLSPR